MTSGRSLPDRIAAVALVVLSCCAVVLTYTIFQNLRASSNTLPSSTVSDWKRYASEGISLGSAQAPVTIVEFSDFQCAFCAQMAPTLRALRTRYGERVRLVYRHFPLSRHPRAGDAALAAECANEQLRFEEFHDAVFALQEHLDTLNLVAVASTAGVTDSVAFSDCLSNQRYAARVRSDTEAGHELQIRGTPTLLINHIRFDGIVDLERLDAVVRRVLR